jgi:hypothetical protein
MFGVCVLCCIVTAAAAAAASMHGNAQSAAVGVVGVDSAAGVAAMATSCSM